MRFKGVINVYDSFGLRFAAETKKFLCLQNKWDKKKNVLRVDESDLWKPCDARKVWLTEQRDVKFFGSFVYLMVLRENQEIIVNTKPLRWTPRFMAHPPTETTEFDFFPSNSQKLFISFVKFFHLNF